MRFSKLIVALGILVAPQLGCTINAFPVPAKVGLYDISGVITDESTGLPVEGVLVIATIEEGGFWGMPSSYDLGHAYTNASGEFSIPAVKQQVYNLHNAYVPVEVETVKYGYLRESYTFPRKEQPPRKVLQLRQTSLEYQMYDTQCLYRTPATCALIRSMIVGRKP